MFRVSTCYVTQNRKKEVCDAKSKVRCEAKCTYRNLELMQTAGEIYKPQTVCLMGSISVWLKISNPRSSLGCQYLFMCSMHSKHKKNRQYLQHAPLCQLSKCWVFECDAWMMDEFVMTLVCPRVLSCLFCVQGVTKGNKSLRLYLFTSILSIIDCNIFTKLVLLGHRCGVWITVCLFT